MGFKLENIAVDKAHKADDAQEEQKPSILEREITLFGKSFSNKKKEDFYTELSVLLKAGITLKESLGLIEEGQKKEKQKNLFNDLGESLLSGSSFSEAIKDKKEFTEYEYYSLKIGEESGTLTTITKELGSFFAKKNEQQRNLVNALTYPIIILVTAVLVVIFMLRLVVPMFQDIFEQNNVELPWITRFIVAVSDFIKDYGWWMVLLILGSLFLRKALFGNDWFKKRLDYFLMWIPYVGNFLKAVYLAQFTRAISLLTASKVPVLNSIELAGKMIDFYPLRDALDSVSHKILQGESLSNSLKGNHVFSNKMISMVKVAEETNQTEFMFERLNQQYSVEVQQKSKLLSTLLEPMIILVVGICVGVILVAMYLPMFKLGSVLG
ncbi:type II secretion system F family protein [Flagellimonas eckloniae]|uniref:General secretion pathway protein GspF n=1 Tax=Flagellimonas eckloniae TaxID=346185 RepID=A0A0Q1CF61_9FLAO|nr:type II secretion system F family protein [Allomuricauda eckloniae]KQC29377.1 general secretion pathway protein GspF [Allomuricauda eckloniae]